MEDVFELDVDVLLVVLLSVEFVDVDEVLLLLLLLVEE